MIKNPFNKTAELYLKWGLLASRLGLCYATARVNQLRIVEGECTRRFMMFEANAQDGVAGPGTVVGANVKLTGTISDVNDITVHGTVEGEVISDKTVMIAETASVKGPVTAQIVTVSGRVNGAVTAHQKLELLPTANINSAITTRDLIIKSGAIFNGKSAMSSDTPTTKEKDVKASEKSETKEKDADSSQKDVLAETLPPKPELTPSSPTFELEE